MKQTQTSLFLHCDFAQILGPRSSASSNFEELVSQLLAMEIGAEAIDGSGGDMGIDCYIGKFRGQLTAFQAKYFLGRLRNSQRVQIQKSFETANNHHKITNWVLCVPIDPTPNEREWLDSLGDHTEWWGETKLRSLLAKYEGIARQFFREPLIVTHLTSIKEEVSRLREELFQRIDPLPSVEQVLNYLATDEKDCRAATEDIYLLYDQHGTPWITIDFCDLYAYLCTDPSLTVHRPLIDFCLFHSPWSFTLPPGTVYEFGKFVQRSPFQFVAEDFLERLRQTPEAQAFVKEFTSDPTTTRATEKYHLFVSRMRNFGIHEGSEVNRLASSLQSGSISAVASEYRNLKRKEYSRALDFFRVQRPIKNEANCADAANIAFLLTSENHLKVPSRMVSSAKSMTIASEHLCSGRALVRTPHQFALLLTAGSTREVAQQKLLKTLNEIQGLQKVFTLSYGNSQTVTKKAEFLPSLLDFAVAYRDLLRPIDDMIEEGFRVISRQPLSRAYYDVLRGEAFQVATFRSFWERVSMDYKTIDDILCKYHGYEEIADQIENDVT